jgi:hypothetical protein
LKDFYIDFSEYPEEVAKVLYEEVQKHAFELGYEWCGTKKALEKYNEMWHIIIFEDNIMSTWLSTPTVTQNKMSVEDFLKMEKEPEYHVGMPMGQSAGDSIVLYLNPDGAFSEGFTGVALKHGVYRYQYTTNDYYDSRYWKPIDPSRIKVTIK